MSRTRRIAVAWSAVAVAGLAAPLLGGCSSSDGDTASTASGAELARERGCVACHGGEGTGGAGPAWTGLAGSTVELDDGRSLVADEAYLRRSITDPDVERVKGYNLAMPQVDLAPSEVDELVDYISSLK